MNILFLAHYYNSLYKIIEEELIEQGHSVYTIRDIEDYQFIWYKKKLPLHLSIKKFIVIKLGLLERYWKKQIQNNKLLCQSYDLLFVIQGVSFSPLLLNHLRKYNPNIRTSLYIWDSNRYIDYFHNILYFDKVYSFDWYDVKTERQNNVGFLPFFWPKSLVKYDNEPIIYDISSIGTCHDGRLGVFKAIVKQLEAGNYKYFLKLVVPQTGTFTIYERFNLIRMKLSATSVEDIERYLISKGEKTYSFISKDYYSPDEMNKIMAESRSVLDTDRELQGGTTPRLIWAMALNKHIFTTNKKIIELPFYKSDSIHIIDRNDPYVDLALASNSQDINTRNDVLNYRIDNWVKYFI